MSLLPTALAFLQRGWSVIPVGLDKRPLILWKEYQSRMATPEELIEWFEKYPDAQIGIVTGSISNLTVIDVESDGDFGIVDDQTLTVETGGKGRHFYFQYEKEFKNAVKVFPSVDVRSEGGYIIAYGSKSHKGPYKALNDLPVAKMPSGTKEAFLEANRRQKPWFVSDTGPRVESYDQKSPEYGGSLEGSRNDSMTKYAGVLHAKLHQSLWASVGMQMFEEANRKNSPPLSMYELSVIWNSISQRELQQNPAGRNFSPSYSSPRVWGPTPDNGIDVTMDVIPKHNMGDAISGPPDLNDLPQEISFETRHISDVADLQTIDSSKTFSTGMVPFDEALLGGFSLGELVVVAGQSGHGKCLAKGTRVVLFDGSVRKVEDIVVGDLLLGPDSRPRYVKSLANGTEQMYKIVPRRGDPYVVNESHILSLRKRNVWSHGKRTHTDSVVNINVLDFLRLSKTEQRCHYGYHSSEIFWRKKDVPVDPYFLGLWLGDGNSSGVQITTADDEIREYLSSFAEENRHNYHEYVQSDNKSLICSVTRAGRNANGPRLGSIQDSLRRLGVLNNKHIPLLYKANDRKIRLALLAGLIDSDGCLNPPGSFEFTVKSKTLAEDVAFISRSLGFFVTTKKCTKRIRSRGFVGEYYRLGISGDLTEVPLKIGRKKPSVRKQIKDILVTSIEIQPVGIGEYYGFEIDGDGLFLLEDFSVTHNTTLIQDWSVTLSSGGPTKVDSLPSLWFSYEVLAKPLWQKFQLMGADINTPVYMPCVNESGDIDWVMDVIRGAIDKWGVKVICIDHLGFLRPPVGRYSNASDAITHTVRALKQFAVKNGLIILLPVHIRKTNSKTPDLNDIRDSLGIAQEADSVFFIARDKDEAGLPTSEAKVWLVKNRKSGIAVSATLNFQFGRYYYNPEETERREKLDSEVSRAMQSFDED